MTTLTEFEPFVDRTISLFFDRLRDEFVSGENRGKTCNVSKWLQLCTSSTPYVDFTLTRKLDAFDVIGELTFSRRLGFLDKGEDVDGIMADLDTAMRYNAVVSTNRMTALLFVASS